MQSVKLNGKTVFANGEYCASSNDLVGREAELAMILAAWMYEPGSLPLNPLLLGPPGVGKNHLAYEAAKRCGLALFPFQCHEDVTAEDFACTVRPSEDPGRKVDYILSSLTTAMITGGVCFVDEIGKLRPRALAPLASVLDERRYIDSTLLGERIYAHPAFRFIAATNTSDLDAQALPDFISSRLRPAIDVGYASAEEIKMILRNRLPRLGEETESLLDCFWSLWKARRGDQLPCPRDVIYVFGFALNLAASEANGQGEHDPAEPKYARLQARHIELSFAKQQLN